MCSRTQPVTRTRVDGAADAGACNCFLNLGSTAGTKLDLDGILQASNECERALEESKLKDFAVDFRTDPPATQPADHLAAPIIVDKTTVKKHKDVGFATDSLLAGGNLIGRLRAAQDEASKAADATSKQPLLVPDDVPLTSVFLGVAVTTVVGAGGGVCIGRRRLLCVFAPPGSCCPPSHTHTCPSFGAAGTASA